MNSEERSDKLLSYVERIAVALEKIAGGGRSISKPRPVQLTTNIIPKCPICESVMVQRTRRSDDSLFWGCTKYPDCKGTRNEDGSPTVNMPKTPSKTTQPSSLESENVPF